jgi:hypothetical protein
MAPDCFAALLLGRGLKIKRCPLDEWQLVGNDPRHKPISMMNLGDFD